MSIIKIADIAHVRFTAPDLAEMQTFLTEFGLSAALWDDGALYARGAGPAPFLHATAQGEPGFAALGLRADSVADLERLAAAQAAAAALATAAGAGAGGGGGGGGGGSGGGGGAATPAPGIEKRTLSRRPSLARSLSNSRPPSAAEHSRPPSAAEQEAAAAREAADYASSPGAGV